MKEKNTYTLFLAALGCTGVIMALVSVGLSGRAWELAAVILGVSILTLFPVKLPNHFWYAFDHIAKLYLLWNYDWKIALLPSIIGLLAMNLTDFSNFKRNTRSQCYQFIVSMGMYAISLSIMSVIYHHAEFNNTYIMVGVLVFFSELISLLLNKIVHVSILGWSVLGNGSWRWGFYPTIFFFLSCIFLYRLVQTDSYYELGEELLFTSVTLFLLSVIARTAVDHQFRADGLQESLESRYSATGQLFIQLDLKGRISYANTIAERILGIPSEAMGRGSLWNYLKEQDGSGLLHFNQAAEGLSGEWETSLGTADGSTVPAILTFFPYLHNKKVTGIFLTGRMLRSSKPGFIEEVGL